MAVDDGFGTFVARLAQSMPSVAKMMATGKRPVDKATHNKHFRDIAYAAMATGENFTKSVSGATDPAGFHVTDVPNNVYAGSRNDFIRPVLYEDGSIGLPQMNTGQYGMDWWAVVKGPKGNLIAMPVENAINLPEGYTAEHMYSDQQTIGQLQADPLSIANQPAWVQEMFGYGDPRRHGGGGAGRNY